MLTAAAAGLLVGIRLAVKTVHKQRTATRVGRRTVQEAVVFVAATAEQRVK